jgi:hypothetical protein
VSAAATAWLLESDEPAVRALVRSELLRQPGGESREAILAGPKVRALLDGPGSDGGHPYRKWQGPHWRLVALVELGVPEGDPRALQAVEAVLAWLTSDRHRSGIRTIDGLVRRCASQEGNALAICSRLGLAGDPRVELLARSLVAWQWPDGGWNCDKRASGYRSSFHESLPPAWGLHEYARVTGASWAAEAAQRTAELFLSHHVYRSIAGEVIDPRWLKLRWPPYWHYDVLQALLILGRLGRLQDPRCAGALDAVEGQRRPDGRWNAGGRWWRPPGGTGPYAEAVDWGPSRPSQMVTLNALRVVHQAGR